MSFLNALSRITLNATTTRISTSSKVWLHSTPVLWAEPLKKKKKLDPQIIKQRDDRRRKKLEKQIRRLEKNARQLQPVEELEVPTELLDERDKRARKLPAISDIELEQRAQLKKQWAHYKHDEKVNDFQIIDRLVQSQCKALEELRKESEALYQEAIQPDVTLLPMAVKGPVATPPIENYNSPDGDYLRQAKKWE